MKTGFTSTTMSNLLIGPGLVYKGFQNPATPGTLLGATMGGNEITIEREYHAPEIDGVLGPIKGSERVIRESAKATVRLLEVTKDNLLLALAGASSSSYGSPSPTHDKITSNASITLSHYTDIAIVGEIANKQQPIIFVIKNALATEPLEIPLGDGKGDVALQVTFVGHFDPASPTTAPYEIYVPQS